MPPPSSYRLILFVFFPSLPSLPFHFSQRDHSETRREVGGTPARHHTIRDSSGRDAKFDRITTTAPGRDTGERAAAKRAMGHPLLSMNPGLFVVATLWVREHNRLCDRLSGEQPAWTDEQVYSTARRIVIGQMMRMMIGGGAIDGVATAVPAFGGARARARAEHGRFSTPFELLLIAMWPAGEPVAFDGNRSTRGRATSGRVYGRFG